MSFDAKVIADSVSPDGFRLTSFQVTIPRIVLAEFNTHRRMCLAGSTELYFELPTKKTPHGHIYKMDIATFWRKWHVGTKHTRRKKGKYDLSKVCDDKMYSTKDLAETVGMRSYTAVVTACKVGGLPFSRNPRPGFHKGVLQVKGSDFKKWYLSPPEVEYSLQHRLKQMQLRCLDESTQKFTTTRVRDVWKSGVKEVFEVTFEDGYSVTTSQDHLFYTSVGWKTLLEATQMSRLPNGLITWSADTPLFAGNGYLEYRDPLVLAELREKGLSAKQIADKFGVTVDAIKYLIRKHNLPLNREGYLKKVKWVAIKSIRSLGEQETYDIEVEGPWHNFVGNGIVVHNSRNSSSSRAIPVEKTLDKVSTDPFVPAYWGKNQKGMSAFTEFEEADAKELTELWKSASREAMSVATTLMEKGVHKQIANRLLEPWLWQTIICTGSEWMNYFNLRLDKNAQPEIRIPTQMMHDAKERSTPDSVGYGEWHLPLVRGVDLDQLREEGYTAYEIAQISCGRCARVSYLTHDGKRDPRADIAMCAERLVPAGHMSPLEHAARPMYQDELDAARAPSLVPSSDSRGAILVADHSKPQYYCGNVEGWVQMRKLVPGEAVFMKTEKWETSCQK